MEGGVVDGEVPVDVGEGVERHALGRGEQLRRAAGGPGQGGCGHVPRIYGCGRKVSVVRGDPVRHSCPLRTMSPPLQASGLPDGVLDELRRALPAVAARTVATLTDEVAEYRAPVIGAAATATIGRSVELALATFLDIAARDEPGRTGTPSAVLEAAYALGRGEARAGRSMEALLAAYRVGARVAWQEQSELMVRRHVPAATIAAFAQLVFAYIDELSGASVAGHRDELATSRAGARAAARTPRTGAARGRTGGGARGARRGCRLARPRLRHRRPAPLGPRGRGHPSPRPRHAPARRGPRARPPRTEARRPPRSRRARRPARPAGRALRSWCGGGADAAMARRPRLVPSCTAHTRPRAAHGGRRDRLRGAPGRARSRRRSGRPARPPGARPRTARATSAPRRRRGCRRRSAPGCSIRAGVSSSPPTSTSTPRPCGTG